MPPEHEAGYELDRAVLERVLGEAARGPVINRIGPDFGKPAVPPFSRDDAAAMRVVDEMTRRGYGFQIRGGQAGLLPKGVTSAAFFKHVPTPGRFTFKAEHVDRRVAICLASLAAVESQGAPQAEGTG